MATVPNTVTSALTLYGVIADTNDIIFNASKASERIENKVLNDNFNTCIDLKFSNLDEH